MATMSFYKPPTVRPLSYTVLPSITLSSSQLTERRDGRERELRGEKGEREKTFVCVRAREQESERVTFKEPEPPIDESEKTLLFC